MPTLESIRRFEKALVSLGSEPEILAERGEEIEEVVPPDEAMSSDSDLQSLLAAPEIVPPVPAAAAEEAAAPPRQEPTEEPALDALDLDVFGITDEARDQIDAAQGPQAAGPQEEAEEFTLPEGLFETAQDEGELPPEAEAPLEAPELEAPELEAPGLEAPEQPRAEAEELGGLEDLSLPDDLFEQAAAEPGPIVPIEEPPAPQPLAEAEPEAPERPPDEETIELPEGGPEETFPLEASAFELPDIELEKPSEQEAQAGTAAGEEAPAQGPVPPQEDFVIDELQLPGAEEAAEAPPAARVAAPPPPEGAYQAEGAQAEYTEEEFEAIREALVGLPLNLRLAVEEQIGARKITGEPLRAILDLLIDGGSAVAIARALEKAAGVRVSLPRGVEKGTGLAFERERGSLGYLLRNRVVPALRVLVPVAGLLAGLFVAGNEYIVKPIEAQRGYRRAVRQIEAGQYAAAAQSFNQATHTHAQLRWFHRAALAYRAKGEYGRAADIYERLLGGKSLLGIDPRLLSAADRKWEAKTRARLRLLDRADREAVLAYANMRTHETLEYREAETLLKGYLAQTGRQGDYHALIALGDNYIEWAAEQPEKYHEAARAYGKAMAEQKPPTDEPIFRMLRTYARTGNLGQVEKLVQGFEQKKRVRIDAAVYAEAAGALIDGGRYDLARQALGRAYDADKKIAEIYYQFGRLFRWTDDAGSERRALEEAIGSYDAAEAAGRPTVRQRKLALLSRNALGELHARLGEPVKAQAVYTEAIERLERQLAEKRLKPAPEFGRLYANSGDVHYYHDGDFGRALSLYEKARSMGLDDEGLGYKIGAIHYEGGNLERALRELHRVAQKRRDNPSALYALANTLYLRGDYFAAQGYYNQLLKQIEARRQRLEPRSAQGDATVRDLVELSMRTYNNLGVNEKKLSQDTRNPNRESRALFYLSRSIEFYDQMTRSPETLERSLARNLGFYNSRAIMYPQAGIELEIYREIPRDLDSQRM